MYSVAPDDAGAGGFSTCPTPAGGPIGGADFDKNYSEFDVLRQSMRVTSTGKKVGLVGAGVLFGMLFVLAIGSAIGGSPSPPPGPPPGPPSGPPSGTQSPSSSGEQKVSSSIRFSDKSSQEFRSIHDDPRKRDQFKTTFKQEIAKKTGVKPSDVVVDGIHAGSNTVTFHIRTTKSSKNKAKTALDELSKEDNTIKIGSMSASTKSVAKPTTQASSAHCDANPDLCCTVHAPNIAATVRHMMDVSAIKRLLSRSSTVAMALSKADWKTSAKIDDHCDKTFQCSQHKNVRECSSATQGKCFWTVARTMNEGRSCNTANTEGMHGVCMPVDKNQCWESTICAGKVTMRELTVIKQSDANEASEVLKTVADALNQLASQMSTKGQSKPPPTLFDVDRFMLDVLEGDWQDVFAKLELLAHGLQSVDWDKVIGAAAEGQSCDSDPENTCGKLTGSMGLVEKLAGKLKLAWPKADPSPTPDSYKGDNTCRLSMISIPEVLSANLDLASIKQVLNTLQKLLLAAKKVDWELVPDKVRSG